MFEAMKSEAFRKYSEDCKETDLAELRDRFAMAALTGLLANSHYHPSNVKAEEVYDLADAMLMQREKTKT